ncbi:MBL fold metallo-hydrolase [Patescibacteria group bacterium]|nr:MBL fold metallo-hydrolase [Patescibacteria group bacterium]
MSLSLQFLGAVGGVTGSNFLARTDTQAFLIDCGLFQGNSQNRAHNDEPFAYDPKEIDFLILTHAHLDHCGLIPKLYHQGFRGKIYCTPATAELAKEILSDSAHIREHGANELQIEALFSYQDTLDAFKLFKTYNYNQPFKDGEIKICLQDAGHILGSAMVEVWASGKKLVFTGDLGNSPVPILRDPTKILEADYVVSESTYGSRLHEAVDLRSKKLVTAIEYAQRHKAKIIIPSFALERTQDLLYILNQLKNQKKFTNLPVFLDSPLAGRITAIYKKYTPLFDEEFQKQLKSDPDLFSFKGFKETATRTESMALNDLVGPAIYIAGSGMADAGRVQHHILHQGNNPNNQIIFVGFQVPGTLGRKLVDGLTRVRVMDHFITVKAKIGSINAFSAHADQKGVLNWLNNFKTQPTVFLVHGEQKSREILAEKITKQLKLKAILPKLKQTIDL